MAMTIPLSAYNRFQFNKELGTRYGQQFHEYMQLHKITNPFDKVWCDKMYEAGTKLARQMILVALDRDN